MLDAKKIPDLLREGKIVGFQIFDIYDNRLFDERCGSVSNAVVRWGVLAEVLGAYGKVVVRAANEAAEKQNFGKGCYRWLVVFSEDRKPVGDKEGALIPAKGYVHEAVYQMELKMLKLRHEMQLLELRRQMGEGKEGFFSPAMVPFICKGIGMKTDDIKEMMALSGMAAGGRLSLAGADEEPSAETLNKVLERVNEKVGSAKLLRLLNLLDGDPSLADKALIFYGV